MQKALCLVIIVLTFLVQKVLVVIIILNHLVQTDTAVTIVLTCLVQKVLGDLQSDKATTKL